MTMTTRRATIVHPTMSPVSAVSRNGVRAGAELVENWHMTQLAQSLGDYLSELDEADFDRLLDARPEIWPILGLDETEGPAEVSVAAAASALADVDGAFFALARLPLPHVYVAAALVADRESVRAGRHAGPQVRELSPAEWERVFADFGMMFGVASYADPAQTRERLCEDAPECGPAVDRILADLAEAALVWPEGGRLRLHDALIGSFDVQAVLDSADPADVLTSAPPPVETVAYRGPDSSTAARAVALATLEEVERLSAAIAAEPVALLKAGGVGVREIKRLAKTARMDITRVRLWLHICEAAGLIAIGPDTVMATEDYDEWRVAEPVQRYLTLVNGWLETAAFPLADEPGRRPPAPLAEESYLGPAPIMRTAVLAAMRTAADGSTPTSDSLAAAAAWSLPLLLGLGQSGGAMVCSCGEFHDDEDGEVWLDPAYAVAQVLAEAETLGAVVAGSLAPWFRFDVGSLASGAMDEDAMAAIVQTLGSVLPQAVNEVRLQGDLTAVASGLPSAALASLLDGCARRESGGAAIVWRFSDSSIRTFLDEGGDGDDLLRRLAEHSVTGTLPQVLEYLVKDAARVHGLVDVIAAATVLVTVDDRLAAEIEAHRGLGKLALRRVAPTVLVTTIAPAAALDALRFAGYAPAAHQADGTVLVTKARDPRLRG